MRLFQLFAILITTVSTATILHASVPSMINYQGRLTDKDTGEPLTGTYDLAFSLYTLQEGSGPGDPQWSETHTGVQVEDGLFSVRLGSVNPLTESHFSESLRWLQIEVGGVAGAPRTQIVCAPYSFRASSADSADAVRSPLLLDYDGEVGTIEATNTDGPAVLGISENSHGVSGINGLNNRQGALGTQHCGVWGTSIAGKGLNQGMLGNDSCGVYGKGQGATDFGVYGKNTGSGNFGYVGGGDSVSVLGEVADASRQALRGSNTGSGNWGYIGGENYAVFGETTEPNNSAVYGINGNSNKGLLGGHVYAVYGEYGDGAGSWGYIGSSNYGVYGIHPSDCQGYLGGDTVGVYGLANSNAYWSGLFEGRVRITDSLAVGTAHPSEVLDVAGKLHMRDNIKLNGNWVSNDGDDEGVYVASGGNVGIGTTTADAALQVGGAIRLGGGANGFEITEELNTDGDPWDSYIGSNGISIGADAGGNRQMILFTDGTKGIFTVASSENSGADWYPRFTVHQNGRVGIGTDTPSEELHVVGDICYTNNIGTCSDVRFKKDIENISDALETIMQLRGVTYRWRQDEFPDKKFDEDIHLGLIAQEVRELIPEVILEDGNGYLSVDYTKLTPVLVEALKEQQSSIDELRERVAQLTELVNTLLEDR